MIVNKTIVVATCDICEKPCEPCDKASIVYYDDGRGTGDE